MLSVLLNDILPVFAMLALGFAMGRTGKASTGEATSINRIAFIVLQPALIYPLIAGIDFSNFDFAALGLYALCEVVSFAAAYLTARFLLGREHLEAWLLGMAVVFVNSLLYIWPVSFLIYGETAALPITAIVALDSTVSFGFFIISMELMAGDKATGGVTRRITRNPVLIAIFAGLTINFLGLETPAPLLTAATFAGAAAAPLTLFAMGVILSGHALTPSPTVVTIAAFKLLAFPALVFTAMAIFLPDNDWTPYFTLNAAGPSGAMAFALALLYKVRTDAIAPVIVWTSFLSLFSLAYLA